ncbi:hypothetical protein [Alkaliphilus transvaalensis]|uniref:hypothetical protein n=1 Tax=Alkaliphilus transvaalensis TaxID=114628 RepID=UPI0012EB8717|nr:hypothetical protein [Alkaliphilus transvaalensis]
MDDIKRLKIEIETSKAQLRRFLEDGADINEILDLNYKIDDLIIQFYHLKAE